MNAIILVVCEGKSEYAYLQELNRFLRENEIPLLFKGEVAEGGDYRFVDACFRSCRGENRKAPIAIWVDHDIYKRNDRDTCTAYANKPKGIPDFKFNYENFEDFLVMHLPDDKVDAWQAICIIEGHFTTPLHASEYEPLLQPEVFPGYKKGELPDNLEINDETLAQLKRHNADSTIKFHSDFAEFMLQKIAQAKTKSERS